MRTTLPAAAAACARGALLGPVEQLLVVRDSMALHYRR